VVGFKAVVYIMLILICTRMVIIVGVAVSGLDSFDYSFWRHVRDEFVFGLKWQFVGKDPSYRVGIAYVHMVVYEARGNDPI